MKPNIRTCPACAGRRRAVERDGRLDYVTGRPCAFCRGAGEVVDGGSPDPLNRRCRSTGEFQRGVGFVLAYDLDDPTFLPWVYGELPDPYCLPVRV